MLKKYRWPSFVFLLVVFSCQKPLPTLQGVDSAMWQEDRMGCTGKRYAMRNAITKEKEKLLGLDEMGVVKLLGRPDMNELFKRNEKFYFYYISHAPTCKVRDASPPLFLIVRFNSVGLAKEVNLPESVQSPKHLP